MKKFMVLIVLLGLLVPFTVNAQWKIVYPDKELWISSIDFATDSNVYAVGLNGVYKSDDAGITWKQITDWNLLLYSFMDIKFIDQNICWLSTSTNDFVKSVDGVKNWTIVNNGTVDGIAFKTFWLNKTQGYACGATSKLATGDTVSAGSGLFWKTTDGGVTWTSKAVNKPKNGFRKIYMFETGKGYLLSKRQLCFTSDNGETWTIKQFPLQSGEEFYYINFANNNDGLLFTSSINRPRKFWVYKTTDGGNNWQKISSISDFSLNGTNPVYIGNVNEILVAGFNDLNKQLIYKSIDGAQTWFVDYQHPINGQITLGVIASRGRVSVAAGDYIFRSDNSLILPILGDSVVTVGQNFVKQLPQHDSEGDSLIYNLKSAPIFLKIEGCSIIGTPNAADTGTYTVVVEVTDTKLNTTSSFKLTVNKTVGVEDQEVVPTAYKLNQNYPNPFNPTTTISYSIPKSSRVKIVVFNALGQFITTLVDEEKSVGSYSTTFNASNLSSGMYFYNITADGFNQTKKMILVK